MAWLQYEQQLRSFDSYTIPAVRTEAPVYEGVRGNALDCAASLDCDDDDGPPDLPAAGAGSLTFNPPREAFS